MGDFADYLGQYLDSTIVQLAKISSACEIFADKCVLNGHVPPHPGDLQRALKEINWALVANNSEAPPSQNNTTTDNTELANSIITDNFTTNTNNTNDTNDQQNNTEIIEPKNHIEKGKDPNTLLESLKDVSNEDRESIKEFAKQQKNVLSQFTINKIHKKVPNVSTKDIRNYIRVLISQGELKPE